MAFNLWIFLAIMYLMCFKKLIIFYNIIFFFLVLDLGRMYSLIARVPDALGSLKQLLLDHIYNQGLSTIEKCGESAINVSVETFLFL